MPGLAPNFMLNEDSLLCSNSTQKEVLSVLVKTQSLWQPKLNLN